MPLWRGEVFQKTLRHAMQAGGKSGSGVTQPRIASVATDPPRPERLVVKEVFCRKT